MRISSRLKISLLDHLWVKHTGKSMARGLVLLDNSSDEEDAGDSSQWGIMARPNINSGSLIGQTTVHQRELIIVTDINNRVRRNNVGANRSNVYCQNEYDGRDTNTLNEICQQSTSGRLPQYQVYGSGSTHGSDQLIRHIQLLKQSREFSLPPFTTGCLCVFKSPPRYRNGTMRATIYYGVGFTYRQNTNRGRGDSAARALAAKATLYQMG